MSHITRYRYYRVTATVAIPDRPPESYGEKYDWHTDVTALDLMDFGDEAIVLDLSEIRVFMAAPTEEVIAHES